MPYPQQNPVAGNHGADQRKQTSTHTSSATDTPHHGHHRLDTELAALRVLINSPASVVRAEAKDVDTRDFERPYCQHIFDTWHALAVEQDNAGHGAAEVNPQHVLDDLQRAGHTQAVENLPTIVVHGDEPKVSRYQVPKTVDALKRARFHRAMDTTGYQLQEAVRDGSDGKAEQALRLLPHLVQAARRAGITVGEVA